MTTNICPPPYENVERLLGLVGGPVSLPLISLKDIQAPQELTGNGKEAQDKVHEYFLKCRNAHIAWHNGHRQGVRSPPVARRLGSDNVSLVEVVMSILHVFPWAQNADEKLLARCFTRAEYKLSDLKSTRKFSVQALKESNKHKQYTVQDFFNANFSVEDLRCDFSLKSLVQVQFSCTHLKLYNSDWAANPLKAIAALKKFFTVDLLKDAGFTVSDLKQSGYSIQKLSPLFLEPELATVFTSKDFFNGGKKLTKEMLLNFNNTNLNFGPINCKVNGYLLTDFLPVEGMTLHYLCDTAKFSAKQIRQCFTISKKSFEPLQITSDADLLRKLKTDAKVFFNELKDAKWKTEDLRNAGFPASAFKRKFIWRHSSTEC